MGLLPPAHSEAQAVMQDCPVCGQTYGITHSCPGATAPESNEWVPPAGFAPNSLSPSSCCHRPIPRRGHFRSFTRQKRPVVRGCDLDYRTTRCPRPGNFHGAFPRACSSRSRHGCLSVSRSGGNHYPRTLWDLPLARAVVVPSNRELRWHSSRDAAGLNCHMVTRDPSRWTRYRRPLGHRRPDESV